MFVYNCIQCFLLWNHTQGVIIKFKRFLFMKNFSHFFSFYAFEKLCTIWIFLWCKLHCEVVSSWFKYQPLPLSPFTQNRLPFLLLWVQWPNSCPFSCTFSLLSSFNVMTDKLYLTMNEFQWLHLYWKLLIQGWMTTFEWEGLDKEKFKGKVPLVSPFLPFTSVRDTPKRILSFHWQMTRNIALVGGMVLNRQERLYLRPLK